VIFDWLAREGGFVLTWWLMVSLAGAAALPLCWRLLGALPDRGWLLARAAGLLLVGFVFWLLGSFGFLQNTPGSVVLAWLIVGGIGIAVYFTRGETVDMRAWWRAHRVGIIAGEILFVVLLFAWALVRAHNSDTFTTEKPMDLMFMSSIMRSDTFPPNDAWMSGYAISYYYFGYFIAAMLGTISGVSSTLTYSLMIALLFALTALGAYGVVYNLVRYQASTGYKVQSTTDSVLGSGFDVQSTSNIAHRTTNTEQPTENAAPRTENPEQSTENSSLITHHSSLQISPLLAIVTGLLAAVFVVLLGNFQAPLIEIPFQTRTASEGYLAFWDSQERDEYPERTAARQNEIPDDVPVTLTPNDMFAPNNAGLYWWWFRASRVIQDRDLAGNAIGIQPIDEFPQFSFILADSHPHVMALPFVILCIGLALNLLLRERQPSRGEIVFYALCLGGLIFLNTWDGPIYMALLVGAEALRRLWARGMLTWEDWAGVVVLGVQIVLLSVLFYLPFLIGFRSQAGGILPNWAHPTLFRQYFIMFGPFLLILVPYLAVEVWRARGRMNWRVGFWSAVGTLLGFVIMMLLLTVVAVGILNAPAPGGIGDIVLRRLSHGVTTLVLLLGIVVVVGRLFARPSPGAADTPSEARARGFSPLFGEADSPATGFVLLLIGVGVALTLVPDYLYLRDVFGVRINTVFKFYYQAWIVFSLASAFAVYSVLLDRQVRTPALARTALALTTLVALTLGLVYPVMGIYNRTQQETGRLTANTSSLTMDGGLDFITGDLADNDYQAIMCLSQIVQGDEVVIIEAVQGTYNPNVGRVGALTGLPVLFNWPGHQRQWRGDTFVQIVGTRESDIDMIYRSPGWDTTALLLDRYQVDYVFFGSSERRLYGSAAEIKFADHLSSTCAFGDSRFYVVANVDMALGN
jgi:YYY domain-containing protein